MQQTSTRSGVYINQATGYRAFVPAGLPPDPPVQFDDEMLDLPSHKKQNNAELVNVFAKLVSEGFDE